MVNRSTHIYLENWFLIFMIIHSYLALAQQISYTLFRHCIIVSPAGYAWCYPCTGYLFLHGGPIELFLASAFVPQQV